MKRLFITMTNYSFFSCASVGPLNKQMVLLSKSNLSSNSDSIIRTLPTTNMGYRSLPSDVTVLFSFRSHFKLKKTIKLDSVFSKNQWENWEKLNFQINFTLSTKAFQSCDNSLLWVTYSSTFFISSSFLTVQFISNISFYL